MKLLSATLVACLWMSISTARADDDEPLVDTPAVKAGQGWMKAMLAPGGAVAAPSKDKPLDYVITTAPKSCKALRTGTAKDFKVSMKLKTCIVDSYKEINATIDGQWRELRASDMTSLFAAFPGKYQKKLKAGVKGSTIVNAHFPGDGLNFDVYLALDADGHVHAVWAMQEAYE